MQATDGETDRRGASTVYGSKSGCVCVRVAWAGSETGCFGCWCSGGLVAHWLAGGCVLLKLTCQALESSTSLPAVGALLWFAGWWVRFGLSAGIRGWRSSFCGGRSGFCCWFRQCGVLLWC